jgi:hypothetical protein
MSAVWAVIVGAIVLLILYSIVSSKLETSRQRKAREKVLPFVAETVRTGQRYNVYMSDGHKFLDVEILGTSDPEDGRSAIGGWGGMLVLKQAASKRVFIRQNSVRYVEEA